MKPAYLVDTDWVIHYLSQNREIIQRLDELKEQGLGLSVISLAELMEGVLYSNDPEGDEVDLGNFFRGVEIVGINEETCRIFGRERGRLRAS